MFSRRLHAKIDHVYSKDPALDRAAKGFEAAWKEFLKTGDVKVLPVKEGRLPVIWKLLPLKRWQKLAVSDTALDKLMLLLKAGLGMDGVVGLALVRVADALVGFGLVDVQGLTDENDRPIKLESVDDGRGGKMLSGACLEMLHELGTHFVNEIGFRVNEITEPDPTSGQG